MEMQYWREFLSPYELAVNELVIKLEHLREEHVQSGAYAPIEQVKGRVKTISSILDKAQRKNIKIDDIEEEIDDLGGIRIICQFVEDIYKVVELLKSRNDLEIKSEKNYITDSKDSGYRSYHLTVYYTVETLKGAKKLQIEIQIRTMAMNFWATIEHSLQYKYQANIPVHIRDRLSGAAEAIVQLDTEMSQIRSEIMDAQNAFRIQAKVVEDILGIIQDLYQYTNKREILKIQNEFYQIYKLNDLERLMRFQRELSSLMDGYQAQDLMTGTHNQEHIYEFTRKI